MKMKKILLTALLGLGLATFPFTAKAVDKKIMDEVVDKTIEHGKFGSADSGSGYEVYLEKEKEKLGEETERFTYLTVKYAIVMLPTCIKKQPIESYIVIDDWEKIEDGYILKQKIITDGDPKYGLPDGKVDAVTEERMVQNKWGGIISSNSKIIDLTDKKILEEVQELFDKNIEYFLNN